VAEPDAQSPRSSRTGRLGLAERVLIAAVVLGVVVAGWLARWTADDAFINYRVVENLLAGNGPVFTAPVRTEVATSPAWLLLLTGAEALLPGNSVAWASVVLGLLGTATGVLFAMLGARRLFSTAGRLVVPFGAVVLLALPPFADFTTSGLETGMSFAWLGLSFWALVRELQREPARAGRPVWLFVLLGVGPLVRPDFALITGLLLLWLTVVGAGAWWRRLAGLVVAGVLPLAYQVFRMGYYGLLIPNTAVAKESGRPLWGRGADYLLDLVVPYALYVPAVLAVAVVALLRPPLPRREWSLVAVVVAAAVVHALYVVRVGGDFMHARLLLPSLFLLLCPVAAVPLPRGTGMRGRLAAVALAATAAWALVAATSFRTDYEIRDTASGLADERAHYVSRAGVPHPVTLEDHGRAGVLAYTARVEELHERGADVIVGQVAEARPGTPVEVIAPSDGGVVFAVGNAGFYGVAAGLDVVVIDVLGLADPVNSHLEAGPPVRAGHEKPFADWYLLARYGADDLAVEQQEGQPAPEQVAAAREALSCGEVAELLAATSDPLTWDRFWDNVRGSAHRTSLRIPLDPFAAEQKFC
jgi:arabinofuranosyltransferase